MTEEILLVSACVLIRTSPGKFEEAVNVIRQIRGVKRVFPVLGRYDAVADFEEVDNSKLGQRILRMGRMAGVVFTETLMEIQ